MLQLHKRRYQDRHRNYASFFILDHILSISRIKANFIPLKAVTTAGLLITTEDRGLHVAMRQNQLLRDALIDGFTASGIPGASSNAARCSSDPQFGLLGRNPNAYEVSARLEVEARNEEHPQFLAAAADGREKRTTKSVSGLNCAP